VHKLRHKGPWTTKELLNITMSHASAEEVVGVIFDCPQGKTKWDEDAGEDASNRSNKKKKQAVTRSLLMAATERKGGRVPTEGTPNHFEKLLEGPCPNHAYPIKYLYKDCTLMKQFLPSGSKKGDQRRNPEPVVDDAEEKGGGFPMTDGYLMIFGGTAA
jgi:hypothetical protein